MGDEGRWERMRGHNDGFKMGSRRVSLVHRRETPPESLPYRTEGTPQFTTGPRDLLHSRSVAPESCTAFRAALYASSCLGE